MLASGESVDVGRELLLLVNGNTGDLVTRTCGCTLPVWTIYPQVVLSTPAPVAPFRSYVGHASRPVALKMVPSRAVMLSGGWRGRLNPVTGRGETTQAHVAGNWAEAVALFPAIGELSVAGGHPIVPETNALDQIPIIDRVPGTRMSSSDAGGPDTGGRLLRLSRRICRLGARRNSPDILKPFALSDFRGSTSRAELSTMATCRCVNAGVGRLRRLWRVAWGNIIGHAHAATITGVVAASMGSTRRSQSSTALSPSRCRHQGGAVTIDRAANACAAVVR